MSLNLKNPNFNVTLGFSLKLHFFLKATFKLIFNQRGWIFNKSALLVIKLV